MISIKFSCSTCRKCHPNRSFAVTTDMCGCKHEDGEFYPRGKDACEHWMPSISDVRCWAIQAKEQVNE